MLVPYVGKDTGITKFCQFICLFVMNLKKKMYGYNWIIGKSFDNYASMKSPARLSSKSGGLKI
jgi:hypothetical protein